MTNEQIKQPEYQGTYQPSIEGIIESGDAVYPFDFETVQVDEKGKIVSTEQGRAFAFKDPLAPDIWLEMVAL
jgi:hypothetical protein